MAAHGKHASLVSAIAVDGKHDGSHYRGGHGFGRVGNRILDCRERPVCKQRLQ
jgi:hypothetical protein